MRISDWSSDVCSSDLIGATGFGVEEEVVRRLVIDAERVGEIVERAAPRGGTNPRRIGGVKQAGAVLAPIAQLDPALVQIGRASGRERVCKYVKIMVGAGYLKKKKIIQKIESETDSE